MCEEAMEMLSPLKMIGDYVVTTKVGSGSFTVVWKAKHVLHGNPVAIKDVDLQKLNKNLRQCLECEINFLRSVAHPNIIRLLETMQAGDHVFLVLEYCAGGDLAAYIRRNGRVHEQVARKFMRQLGAGLEVLHTHHVIHRDLKPENLLLSTDDNDAVLKIADFGLSRCLPPKECAETVCGSPLYTAPEVLQFQKYDAKVDMWSIGAILFELLIGHPPFKGKNNCQVLKDIRNCRILPFPEVILSDLHPDCIDICTKLLCQNPAPKSGSYTLQLLRGAWCDLCATSTLSLGSCDLQTYDGYHSMAWILAALHLLLTTSGSNSRISYHALI